MPDYSVLGADSVYVVNVNISVTKGKRNGLPSLVPHTHLERRVNAPKLAISESVDDSSDQHAFAVHVGAVGEVRVVG